MLSDAYGPWGFPGRVFRGPCTHTDEDARPANFSWQLEPLNARDYSAEQYKRKVEWVSADDDAHALQRAAWRLIGSRWLVLIGDSSMRQLYQHLGMLLLRRWDFWPQNHSARFHEGGASCLEDSRMTWDYRFEDDCLEDFQFRGARVTFVFTRFGDEPSLMPLARLLDATIGAPDAVVAGVGAWWAHASEPWRGLRWSGAGSGAASELYVRTVQNLLAFVERHSEYRRDSRVALSVTNVATKHEKPAHAFVRDFRGGASGGSAMPSGSYGLRAAWALRPPPVLIWATPANCLSGWSKGGGQLKKFASLGEMYALARRHWHVWRRDHMPPPCDARVRVPCHF